MLPSKHSSTHEVGEAYAHVQGESLKAYAALHVRLLNSPITRLGDVMVYSCPRCGSENVQKISLTHGAGTTGISATTLSTGIGRGHGGIGIAATQGEAQSILAKRFSPPKPESAAGPIGCLAILGFAVAVGAGAALNSTIPFWVVIALTAALGVALARQAAANNSELLPKAKALWDRRFICLRCEEVFEPQNEPAPRAAALQAGVREAEPALANGGPTSSERYSVRLLSGGDRPLAALKVVRDLLELRIPEAKQMVETAPHVIRSGLSLADAEAIKAQFEAIGATADIVSHPVSIGAGEPPVTDGLSLKSSSAELPPTARHCIECGRAIDSLAGRCSHCKADQTGDRPVPAWLWAGVAGLLIAGAATYLTSTTSVPTATQVRAEPIKTAAATPQSAPPVRPLIAHVAIESGLLGPFEISGTTNLPDGTLMPIWLEGEAPACVPNCGFAMETATAREGHFKTIVHGKDPPPGRYTVHVTTAEASAQPPNVRTAFGPSGQNLRGPYIVTLSSGGRTYEPANPETENASNYLSGFLVHFSQRLEIGEGGEVAVCLKRNGADDCDLSPQNPGSLSEIPAAAP